MEKLHGCWTPGGTRIWSADIRLLWRIIEVLENECEVKRALEECKAATKAKGVGS